MKKDLARNEYIKDASRYLRGTLAEGVADGVTGAISEDDQQLVKFHGMYMQDDRDLRAERTKKKLEKAFSFMIRLRIPGGVVTPAQWLQLDNIARTYANGTLRLTTRQTFQYHGVIKQNLKTTMKAIDASLLDTIAACGDVNRNVLAATNPRHTTAHAAAHKLATDLSSHLLPKTGAYREIWLDGEKIAGGEEAENEPVYGKHYLPRKFKTVVAVPPDNDVDIYAHDLGFIAILDKKGAIEGWNVTIGGGMGMTHGEPDTYPRTADVLGFCAPEDAIKVGEAVLTVQRDWGDRTNRKHARLKYTVEDRGLDAYRAEVETRIGKKLGAPRPFAFDANYDRYGWTEGDNGRHHLTLFVENGRVRDIPDGPQLLAGLRKIAEVHDGEFRCTANQNVVIANVCSEDRAKIDALVAAYKLTAHTGALRRNAMACVSLPTCGLGLAESERYLPTLVTALEERLAIHGLAEDEITIRMTGCPNGCARPYIAEIGLVGKRPEQYNLYLGGDFAGKRLSKLYAEDVTHDGIIAALDPLFAAYAKKRKKGERFGNFLIRGKYVAKTSNGADFHKNTGPGPAAQSLAGAA
ncbi:sulfite reductase [NADPH] hemoprotein beta-component [Variibacter gotjawalensis]|uniref:Sulfite reductase [NADPH] hemoprotein beta-component n=1 Tax=Variibacter gotjawalensis TaxID=1333996 RepID=A0A0S3PQR5_9BRAD|nr:sulfite reductase (NADPH) hemoprotein beta-component [Variibacter gotjawalensis]RZS50465.1 sulfite reductase (NADPH) hemoprotein beta-component [Variibacter gotjawalensis]BAT58299.1 sulfite reductase [NADPH] hemoprotein beta-component [Variibacter gotjawalensis]